MQFYMVMSLTDQVKVGIFELLPFILTAKSDGSGQGLCPLEYTA